MTVTAKKAKKWNEQTLSWKQFHSNMYIHRVLFIVLNNTKWWSQGLQYFKLLWKQQGILHSSFTEWINSFNPYSPDIHKQILQTGLYTFRYKDKLREFDKRSKHFLLGDNFINSHNLICWPCMDIVRRKLMLVTIGT